MSHRLRGIVVRCVFMPMKGGKPDDANVQDALTLRSAF